MSTKKTSKLKPRQKRLVKKTDVLVHADSLRELKNDKDVIKEELEVIKKDFNKFYKSLSSSAVKIKSWAIEKASEKSDYLKSRIYNR